MTKHTDNDKVKYITGMSWTGLVEKEEVEERKYFGVVCRRCSGGMKNIPNYVWKKHILYLN